MYYYVSFNVATCLMFPSVKVDGNRDSVSVNWLHPKYIPEFYNLRVFCKNVHYVGSFSKLVLPQESSVTIHVPSPGSRCKVNFLAVYNKASLDPGLIFFVTLGSQSRQLHTCICTYSPA